MLTVVVVVVPAYSLYAGVPAAYIPYVAGGAASDIL